MTICKTGAEHLRSLQDGRTVYIDGELVSDVTEHPAFRNAVRSGASLYDFQARPENVELMTFVPNGSKRRVNRAWQMPRSYDEMVLRRKALQAWAGVSCGFMGRSPDHVARRSWVSAWGSMSFAPAVPSAPRRSWTISTTPARTTSS
jgi:4-hydroxyphenylacetate 3-monooxygenase